MKSASITLHTAPLSSCIENCRTRLLAPLFHRDIQPTTGRLPFENEAARDALPGTGLVALERVTVCRGARKVLREVNLSFAAGTVTAIVGRSGVGKTTLLSVLNGLLKPDRGSVAVAGLGALDCGPVLRRHRGRTATIFQEHALIGRLSAIDNVLLGLADARHPLSPLPWPKAMRLEAAVALAEVGLLERATTRVSQLSGGERQRVGVARALVRRPSLLLADEPFASLDPALTRQLSEHLRAAVSRLGLTVVIVLHQIDAARALSDRIVGLRDGRAAFDAPARAFDATAQAAIFDP